MTWAFMSIYVVLAILLSLGGAITIFMIVFSKRIAPDVLLFALVATAGALGYFIGGRNLNDAQGLLMASVGDAGETWVARFANLISLGLCLVALVQVGINGAISRAGVLVAVAALQYYFICFLMPVSFDRWFVFDHRLLYPLAALLVVLMPSRLSIETLAINFARVATAPAALSLLLIAVKHDAAILDSYQSLLPFFKGRLYGAAPHPNVLGSLAAFAVLLLTTFPPKGRREFYILLAIDLLALLLSQSKTSWLTLLLGLGIVNLPRIRAFRGHIPAPLFVGLFVLLAVIPAAASVFDHGIYDYWSGNQNVEQLGTLTGRTDIWKASLFLVKQHLITGPGYATFQVYMQSLFPDLVPNPHNLYLATLVQAGIIGLVSLAIYLVVLILAASSLQGRNRLFAFAYIALVCLRGMSESFSFQDAFTAPNFWTLLMFMRLVAVAAAEERASAPVPAPASLAPARLRAA